MTVSDKSTSDRYRRPTNARTSTGAYGQGGQAPRYSGRAEANYPHGGVSRSKMLDAQLKRDRRIHKTAAMRTLKRSLRSSLGVIISLFLGAFALYGIARGVLVVRQINIIGNSSYEDSRIIGASGIELSSFMYSIDKQQAQNAITLMCPNVKTVYINRKLPSTLEITVTEDSALYYTEICGEYFLLTSDLRTVGHTPDKSELDAAGYGEVILPTITRAIAGREVQFKDNAGNEYIKNVMRDIENSPLSGRVTRLDSVDKFDITVICDGKYRIYLGDTSDAAVKLAVAAKILEDDIFNSGVGASVDVSNPRQSRVVTEGY